MDAHATHHNYPSPDTESAARLIADSTVGFCTVRVNEHKEEDASPAGSGTLVKIGHVAGILTAGHVLRKGLPESGMIGLVRFPNRQSRIQRKKIDMGLTDRVVIWSGEENALGPDLGFLRLTLPDVADLEATNTFLNLKKRLRTVTADKQPGPPYFDAVVGEVGEWTSDLAPFRPGTRLKGFQLLFGAGDVLSKYQRGDYDLCRFDVSFSDPLRPPSSYGGVSGGALWRIYYDVDDDGATIVRERRLVGIAFYQERQSEGRMVIVCHGPKSIYRHLIDAVRAKWPNDC